MRRNLFRFLIAALSVLFVVTPLVHTQAAALTGRSDIMSRQNPSVGSNHEIRFITSSGVNAPSDTITIDFPSGFNLSAIAFGDVDLFHGAITGFEINETVAASPAAGVWGAGISGQRLTLTAPTNAILGEIAVGNIVHIRIGTNVTGGVNKIINPSGGGGTVTISIGGTFGDVGGIDVFIEISDTIGISAVIPSSGGGGGGGGDVTAPSIFDILVLNITTSTAVVTWSTDEGATTLIRWGTNTAYALGNYANSFYSTGHSVPLDSLPPGRVIHFQISAVDFAGNARDSTDHTFTTLSVPAAPIISNVHAVLITDTSATITWNTNIPASSLVSFGLTSGYGSTTTAPGNVTSHSVLLTGLTRATLYRFRVQSTESSGLFTSVSPGSSFTTTGDRTAPANVFGFTATPGNAQNTLHWSNPADVDFSFVKILAKTSGYPTSTTDGRLVYQGNGVTFVDVGLTNGTTYYYKNFAFDGSDNHSSGALASARPVAPPVIPPPPTPPPPVTPPPTTPPTTGGGSTPRPPPTTPPTTGGSTTTTHPIPPIGSATPTPPIVPPTAPTSTTSTEPEMPVISISPKFYTGDGLISLEPDASGSIGVAQGSPILVRVPVYDLPSTLTSAVIHVGSSVYALSLLPGGTDWGATFVPSLGVERVPITVQFLFEDGKTASASTTIETLPFGRILERLGVAADLTPVSGATVRLYENNNGQWQEWQGTQYGQANPMITGTQGTYGFSVQNGQYRIIVEKDGYITQQKELNITRNFVSVDVILPIVVGIPIIGPILEALQSEQARETATIAAPVVVALALANLAAAGSMFSLLNYLWFLLTQPILLLGRKKREKWGTVYNSLSKRPLDLAIVRLVQAQTGAVIQTRVTDINGRFTFRVKPGVYRVEVVKPGYIFPTALLKDQREDVDLLDLYHGESIEVKEESNVAVNVPIDPIVKEETPFVVLVKRFLRNAQHAFSLVGVFVTLVALIIAPSWLMAGLLLLQLFTYLLFRRLALPKKPKEWGIIYDAGTRRPLGTAIVRIFDKKFNKLLETQVTNSKGQYGFFASKSLYFITAEKPEFENYHSEDINLANVKATIVDKHIPMKKVVNNLSTGSVKK